jgi:hypothetical protein
MYRTARVSPLPYGFSWDAADACRPMLAPAELFAIETRENYVI